MTSMLLIRHCLGGAAALYIVVALAWAFGQGSWAMAAAYGALAVAMLGFALA